MASSIPIVRQISWIAVIPLIGTYIVAITGASHLAGEVGPFLGVAFVLAYSYISRLLIARDHRTGIAYVKTGQFAEAIPHFKRSFEFFDRHSWIDRYRSIVMMSASAMSYREMALANEAFCYSQIGNGIEARRLYEECLRYFPNSGLATASLRMLDSANRTSSS